MKRFLSLGITVLIITVLALINWDRITGNRSLPPVEFDGARAFEDVAYQVSLGPRVPGSTAHAKTLEYFENQLTDSGWKVEHQDLIWEGQSVQNLIAKRGSGPLIVFGAHYDSRIVADQDPLPDNQGLPVPGANDGASGAAILLELARVLPSQMNLEIWLAFFDAEDQGNLPGWDWILGSNAMAANLPPGLKPEAVIIVDMIGDADLNIYMERNSDAEITREIWAVAASLGYSNFFIPELKYAILDDHTPFLNLNIRAVDIIDFDYHYWHTTQDTLDKVSAESLEVVGRTLQRWIMVRNNPSN